jgi:para-nitrobenzyl esterase
MSALVVQIESGAVRGLADDAVHRFFGIPYAAPPVGALRWRAPQPVQPWSGVRDALKPGAWCLQRDQASGAMIGSEDCLYLNVTTPAQPATAPRPVLVWVHGGSWSMAGGDFYDGRRLVEAADVIVVTINYRLGLFGFLNHSALEEPGRVSGDCGLEDQIAALAWVQRDIAAFGGDPGQVTLGGESAGGMSVLCHLHSPMTRGLFQRAIVHCTAGLATFPRGAFGSGADDVEVDMTVTREEAYEVGAQRVAALGIAGEVSAEALRALPAERLLDQAANALAPMTAVRGGAVVPEDLFGVSKRGEGANVPLLVGNSRDEHSMFAMLTRDLNPVAGPIKPEDWPAALERAFGSRADDVNKRYSNRTPGQALSDIVSDCAWSLTSYRLAARSRAPAYCFHFAEAPVSPLAGMSSIAPGVFHAAEMPYLFNRLGDTAGPLEPPAQRALSEAMLGYWGAFVRSGDPNGGGRLSWAPFRAGDANALELSAAKIAEIDFAAAHQLRFWDEVRD